MPSKRYYKINSSVYLQNKYIMSSISKNMRLQRLYWYLCTVLVIHVQRGITLFWIRERKGSLGWSSREAKKRLKDLVCSSENKGWQSSTSWSNSGKRTNGHKIAMNKFKWILDRRIIIINGVKFWSGFSMTLVKARKLTHSKLKKDKFRKRIIWCNYC